MSNNAIECVGLFGTCGSSTWRAPFIEAFEAEEVEYFNPQVEDWTPELRERAQRLNLDISLMRDQLARLSVLAQRRAQALVPVAADDTTYENSLLGKSGPGRARIYHAAS